MKSGKNTKEDNQGSERGKRVITKDVALSLPSLLVRSCSAFKKKTAAGVTELRHHRTAFWLSEKQMLFSNTRVFAAHIFQIYSNQKRNDRKKIKFKSCLFLFLFSWYSRDCAKGRDAIEIFLFSTQRNNTHDQLKTRKPQTHTHKVSFTSSRTPNFSYTHFRM